MKISLLFAVGLLTSIPASAQHHAPHDVQAQHAQPPYAGLQTRAIKSLSEQQIADLHAGKGMSLALPAELNGYPGPSHVLELAGQLGLSEEQLLKTKQLFGQMQAEAKALGEELIAGEYELDRLFREKTATPESVQEAAAKAALVQGRLRACHLKYHLSMAELLTPAQMDRYRQLRGYQ